MKGFLSKTMIFLGIFSLVFGTMTGFGSNVSYAVDLELIGEEIGLVVIPAHEKLFDLQNLIPGDRRTAKLTIKNDYSYPFHLYMRTERMSAVPIEGEADLFDQLLLTINLGGNILYSGPMMDFATSNISLGNFNPNNIEELTTTVYLPGPETGNEFQDKAVDVKWIFIATADIPSSPPKEPIPEANPKPSLPKTGTASSLMGTGLGTLLLTIGLFLRRKNK